MKKLVFLATVILSLVYVHAAGLHVTVTNTLDLDRNREVVSVRLTFIKQQLGLNSFIIVDREGMQMPYQILADQSTVIFPATVKAHGTAMYEIKVGTPEKFGAQTFGRFVPERKDDFAWENDRIAFRMYGPKLAPEKPSNGVDVWLKKTANLVVDKRYDGDLNKKISYHVDHGEGLDCYKVAHTLGAGGIAPYTDTTLWVANYYNRWKVLENGPLRTTFQLMYDSVQVGKEWLKEVLTISIDAGSQLNKAVVSYTGKVPAGMKLAAGLFLHDKKGRTEIDKNSGWVGYAETATSDAGLPAGRNYVGVVFGNKMIDAKTQGDHLLALGHFIPKSTFVYYFGAGWSEWGFSSDQVWFDYLHDFSLKMKHPLKINVIAK